MRHVAILLLFSITLFLSDSSLSSIIGNEENHIATCTGSSSCFACKNCKYCKHCSAGGGTCGVCSSSGTDTVAKPKARSTTSNTSTSSQCKGTTKKGARCKRMVRGGGYCYQHG